MEYKKSIVVAAPVQSRSGYGAHSRDIVKALIDSDKYNVSIIPIRWGGTPLNALDENSPSDRKILERLISGQLQQQPDIFIHITIPNEFQVVGKKNIGITAGIETTICRQEWIDGINRMDLTLATSEHSKAVFMNTRYEKRDSNTNQTVEVISCKKPIDVLFEGIDVSVYNSKLPAVVDTVEALDEIEEDFCFLFVGHWLQGEMGQDRKNVSGLVHLFLDAFKRKAVHNRPALILKSSLAGFSITERSILTRKIQDIKSMILSGGLARKLPNIYLLHGDMTDDEMNTLYNHKKVKAMVSFTKGEGYGRPLSEFTTTGKPVIASAWSGQLDFLHKEYSVLLPGKLEKVHPSATNDWILPDASWFSVDYAKAGQILIDVHENYELYLEKSRKHKKYTTDNFSFEKMQSKLCEIIDKIDDYKPAQFKELNIPATLTLPKLRKI
jgi:hypothetical protein